MSNASVIERFVDNAPTLDSPSGILKYIIVRGVLADVILPTTESMYPGGILFIGSFLRPVNEVPFTLNSKSPSCSCFVNVDSITIVLSIATALPLVSVNVTVWGSRRSPVDPAFGKVILNTRHVAGDLALAVSKAICASELL